MYVPLLITNLLMPEVTLLIQERAASSTPGASFTDIPLPTRHHLSRLRAQGRGGGSFKAERRRITLRDFPKEWLPAGTGTGA